MFDLNIWNATLSRIEDIIQYASRPLKPVIIPVSA